MGEVEFVKETRNRYYKAKHALSPNALEMFPYLLKKEGIKIRGQKGPDVKYAIPTYIELNLLLQIKDTSPKYSLTITSYPYSNKKSERRTEAVLIFSISKESHILQSKVIKALDYLITKEDEGLLDSLPLEF